MAGEQIRRVPHDEVDGDEEWVRVTDEEDILEVGAVRRSSNSWPWKVSIWVAEFVRGEPLEGELEGRVTKTLLTVPGVTDVAREDREVWIVRGAPSGPDLVRAGAAVVDALASKYRAHIGEHLRGEDR